MKKSRNGIRLGAGLLIMLFVILIPPYLVFPLQDKRIINIVKQMNITPVTVNGFHNGGEMKLIDKLTMIGAGAKDVEQVDLKMGEEFSLYEARKQCFKELCKIPFLEMDIYGPVKDEINITPKLFIDIGNPSYTMIAWIGTVTIKDVTYRVALDEESKKLILLQVTGSKEEFKKEKQEQLEIDWKEYLKL